VTSGYVAVPNLIARYTELIDGGDFAGVAELLQHCTLTVEETGSETRGREDIQALYDTWTRRYEDNGTPHTKHVTTNLILDVDDDAGTAACRSYVTVFQGVGEEFPIQPIYSGRYRDRFEREGGEWRFVERHMIGDFVGDLSHHLLQPFDV
jgi:hypothetical protein